MSERDIKRRIPLDKEFISDKGINDLIYCIIQRDSIWNPNIEKDRFLLERGINYSRYAKELGIDRRVISKGIQYLCDREYIIKRLDRNILSSSSKSYILISLETLNTLLNTQKRNIIKVYTYLFQQYKYNKEKGREFVFSNRSLLKKLGYNTTQSCNYKKIEDIIKTLESLGLIEYREGVELLNNRVKRLTKVVRTGKKW